VDIPDAEVPLMWDETAEYQTLVNLRLEQFQARIADVERLADQKSAECAALELANAALRQENAWLKARVTSLQQVIAELPHELVQVARNQVIAGRNALVGSGS
jgi:cell division protein FtsB